MRVLLVRHGQSAWNIEKRWQGWTDIPLTTLGEEQARARAATLLATGVKVPVVFSSDLSRARRTAEILAEAMGAALVTNTGLRERNGGSWQGLTATEIDELWPGVRDQWRRGLIDAPPGGESDGHVLARVDGAINDIVRMTPDGHDAVAVTHGGVLRLVTHRAGVDDATIVENVGGHWFRWTGDALAAAEPLPSLSTDGVTTVE